MSWSQKLININNEMHRVLYDTELLKVIGIVDNLDKEFIDYIIENHNEAVGRSFRDGIKEGRKIVKDVYGV